MDCSTPGFPVHHQLPEPTQTHVHHVGDAIQLSHPLSSPSPPTFNLSQHQGLFQGVSFSHQVAKVLDFQLQHQSFQWIFRTDLLRDGLVGSPCSPKDSQESSPTPQFKSINSSMFNFLYGPALTSYMTTGKTIALTWWTFVDKVMSLLFNMLSRLVMGFPCSSVGKESACSAGDLVSIPGLGRSPGEGNGNALQYPCLENLMDRGAWGDAVHGVTKSWAQLSS